MAFAKSPNTHDLYYHEENDKKFPVFLFIIPIMFCFAFFLSVYLFFIKKQASGFSDPPPPPSPTFRRSPSFSFVISFREVGSREDLIYRLPMIVFDEELKSRDSLCCICLGEFEMKEELSQIPLCKHIFHEDCIHRWLLSTSRCPLCRCPVIFEDNNKYIWTPPPPRTSPRLQLPAATSIQLAQANLAD